jgi:hypothetical protein
MDPEGTEFVLGEKRRSAKIVLADGASRETMGTARIPVFTLPALLDFVEQSLNLQLRERARTFGNCLLGFHRLR